ncbi:hypothetical protein LTR84_007173 [Exophiala bonariae]|uniref:Uncharacterized protein n=1 Tax=Exophiala bonariae TaxID=1690606 RepID=A0AAV9N1P3_9EURO|nr:hypothetical protein LTR84_007173 [Exophiala bonariae]
MEPPPPPPPPHGQGSSQPGGRSGGLPDGKYDIFVIPPHSSGSGFLYLPSLQTQRNSFLAGCFCTAASFFIYTTAVPVLKDWLLTTINGGGGGVFMLICCIAVVAWALGKTQGEWAQPAGASRTDTGSGGHKGANSSHYTNAGPPPQPQPTPPPQSPPPPPPPPNNNPPPQSSWQRSPPQANTKANTAGNKSSWEKAREETRKREEERKRAEELKRRREELEKERQRQRDKDASERLEREKKEKKEKEEKAAAAAAARAELEKERIRLEAQAAADAAARARAEAKAQAQAEAQAKSQSQSSPKRPPMPSARTERDDDAYSFRPYDRPKQAHKANSAASMYSESSYAPSQSTARTTPPPSTRGPYSTKDPDKIIIKGVFQFNSAFTRTPVSQLLSNQGNVTDGLILRITTEGFFIDDDVRGVAQREWDVKAWTIKLVEVCYSRGHPSSISGVKRDTDQPVQQSCELSGMHVLRATLKSDGRKYVFILSQSEGWKVAVGLQRLRRGSLSIAMGVAGLPQNEAKAILENLGFA